MGGFQYLADGHHVDDAGNLIVCTYVDFRDPAERFPITALRKASSKRHAIPGCGTIRISKPACFLDQGEGLASDGEVHHGTNGWVYCASIEPERAEEQAAWRTAMPAGRDAVSPIGRPRAFARALGAMVAEQAGPRGGIVLLRTTVDENAFRTVHRSQTVYHGPVVYAEDPVRRLERASTDLELLLLLVLLKHAAYRAQREYRFVVWTEEEPEVDRVDLTVAAALVDAMQRLRQEPAASGVVQAGLEESSAAALAEVAAPEERVEPLPAGAKPDNPAFAPRRSGVDVLPADLRERTMANAALDALRNAVTRSHAEGRQDAVAAARHAEPIVQFLCSAYGGGIADVRVSDDNSIVITATLAGGSPVEASIAVGPEGNCACKISVGDTHRAARALDVRSFEELLRNCLTEAGVRLRGRDA